MQPLVKPLAPIDPDAKLPKAVRDSAAKANSHYKKPELDYSKEPDKDPPEGSEKPAEPTKEPLKGSDKPGPEAALEPAKPGPGPAPEPAKPAADPPVEPPKTQNWEHAYKSMKGRYERSEMAVGALRDQVAELTNVVGTLQRQPAPKPKEPRTYERLVTDKDLEDYGPDLLKVVGNKAREEFTPLMEELKEEIAGLKGQLRYTGEQVASTAQDRMYSTLDTKLPNWREVNESRDFLNWLALPDRFSGVIRQELLNHAVEQNSAPRVLAFFEGFLSEEAASGPGDISPLQPATPPAAKVALETFAAPGRAKTAAPSTVPAEKPIITRAQIKAFYADVNRGVYRGRDDEKAQAERMISEASRDGRIQ